ncbi:hypothetical protein ACLEPN_15475 [Myxococcus sp. 1LA]
MAVGALSPESSGRLARVLLGGSERLATWVSTLNAEGQGHPFFITELARLAQEGTSPRARARPRWMRSC